MNDADDIDGDYIDGRDPPRFPYRQPPGLSQSGEPRHPVVIVGAGPVGLAAAIDLTQRGIPVVVLDDDDRVSVGSRAICWSRRSLDYLDRLGVAETIIAKGVVWETGKLFHTTDELYRFTLAADSDRKHPAFVNLQQYYVEAAMVARLTALDSNALRWKNAVRDVRAAPDGVTLAIDCPDGAYEIEADYVIAADGVRSTVRRALGLDFAGRVFQDQFLIADVEMKADFPKERWFWFDPPFNPGQSALLHMQADNIWRIDLQLGPEADAEAARDPKTVTERLHRMLGADAMFDLVWVSVYTFQCRRLEKFRHGRVLFAGDAAHQVSPFGARGGNGGLQDIDNLGWKLAAVIRGDAPDQLLESYDDERIPAADENILNSTRSTDFITPKTPASRSLRDSVLALAADWPFARALVNSGRLSTAHRYQASPLLDDAQKTQSGLVGASLPNSAVTIRGQRQWLHDHLTDGFCLLTFGAPGNHDGAARIDLPDPALAARLGVSEDGAVLVRPDHHVAAMWPHQPAEADVAAAIRRSYAAAGNDTRRRKAAAE